MNESERDNHSHPEQASKQGNEIFQLIEECDSGLLKKELRNLGRGESELTEAERERNSNNEKKRRNE